MRHRWWIAAATVATLVACGGSSNNSSGGGNTLPDGFYIAIQGMAYTPLTLHVPPGGTVTVLNRDTTVHSVTSEATPGAFTPGGVAGITFDTGTFAAGSRTFTIPTTAPDGTVIPYYCTPHMAMMTTPNGAIQVDSTAVAGPPPGGTTGGGGGGGGGGGY